MPKNIVWSIWRAVVVIKVAVQNNTLLIFIIFAKMKNDFETHSTKTTRAILKEFAHSQNTLICYNDGCIDQFYLLSPNFDRCFGAVYYALFLLISIVVFFLKLIVKFLIKC